MKQPIIKITVLLLLIGLNWAGLSAVINTFAYFSDTAISSGNTFTLGTLDFSLSSPTDDFINLTPGEENQIAKREIKIQNQGTLGFWYKITTTSFSKKCKKLNLALILEDGTKITQPLKDFQTDPIQFSDLTDDLEFVVSPAKNISGKKTCDFTLQFEAWQDETFGVGFWDIEEISNTVRIEREKNKKAKDDIVINEFLPNPSGDDCDLKGLEGEWVEIYNRGTEEFNLEDWYLLDSENNKIVISEDNTYTSSTIIGAKDSGNEWLVVFLNGCILDNEKGDKISLYDEGDLIDSYTYKGSVPENKSFARYPDGSKKWYDPIPTPGGPNRLLEELTEELTDEPVEEPVEELVEEPISDEIEVPVIEEESVEEEVTTKENQEQGGIIEEINEIIDEIVDAIMPDEETGGEVVLEPEVSAIEDIPIIEEESGEMVDEQINEPAVNEPAIEEEPVVVPENPESNNSNPEEGGDASASEGSGDTAETPAE